MRKGILFGLILFITFMLVGCNNNEEVSLEINKESDLKEKISEVDEINKKEENNNEKEALSDEEFIYRISVLDKLDENLMDDGYFYEEGEDNLENKIMIEKVEEIIGNYRSDFQLSDDFFKGLEINIVKGKIYKWVKNKEGVEEKWKVFGRYNGDNTIYLSSDQSKGEFYNTIQHEFGHYFDDKYIDISGFNSYMFSRGHADNVFEFKDFAFDYKTEYFERGREIFARDFSTLYKYNDEFYNSTIAFEQEINMSEEDKTFLKEKINNRLHDIKKIKEGTFILLDNTKEINGLTYVPYFEVFYKLNYVVDDEKSEDGLYFIRNERKFNGNDFFYKYDIDSNTVIIDGIEYEFKDEYPIMVDGYVLLKIFDIKDTDIRYEITDEGIKLWRESYKDINI